MSPFPVLSLSLSLVVSVPTDLVVVLPQSTQSPSRTLERVVSED
jgi:hypothetical protein